MGDFSKTKDYCFTINVQDGRYAKNLTKDMVINMKDTQKAAPLGPE